jgi:hypothetical protein
MKRTWWVAPLLALLAACESPTAWRADVEIESEAVEDVADVAAVEGATGSIGVSGVYRIPSPGYTLQAYYQRAGRYMTLYVGANPPTGPNLAVISAKTYRVTIPVPAGTYAVRVVHRDHGSRNRSREVANDEVTVPGAD